MADLAGAASDPAARNAELGRHGVNNASRARLSDSVPNNLWKRMKKKKEKKRGKVPAVLSDVVPVAGVSVRSSERGVGMRQRM